MKNEDKWFENYEAVKAHVALTGHFPDKHSIGNNCCRYQRKLSLQMGWSRELHQVRSQKIIKTTISPEKITSRTAC